MRMGFHRATSMKSDLEADIAVTAQAGLTAIGLWADKIDKYLANRSLDGLKALLADNNVAAMSINSIEFISFRGEEYSQIQARGRELSQIAQAIKCPTIIVVPRQAPSRIRLGKKRSMNTLRFCAIWATLPPNMG